MEEFLMVLLTHYIDDFSRNLILFKDLQFENENIILFRNRGAILHNASAREI